jgi:hypothetical protein
MTSYLYADTTPLFTLGKAGLLDQLLPQNNGGYPQTTTGYLSNQVLNGTISYYDALSHKGHGSDIRVR